MLVGALRADPDNSGFAVRILLYPDNFRLSCQGVSSERHPPEFHLGVSQIGHSIDRNVGDRLSEHKMKYRKILNRRLWQAAPPGEFVRRKQGVPERKQCVAKCPVAVGDSARRRVLNHHADAEILKKPSRIGFC